MKKLTLTFLTLTIIMCASAQVPQALNYQAIARNSLGQIVPSQNIGVRFTILDGTGSTIYYQETHNATTNNFGLFTLAIGKGTAVSGTIPSIDWSAGGDKYLKVEIAPQGGTNYTIQGSTQLLSVPYALYAEKTRLIGGNAITITNGNTISANYVAGTGINITGNIISSTANLNSWLLNGNATTTAANFLGTTDNLPLNIRTNNLQRMSISESNIVGSNNISYVQLGQQSNFSTNPVQLGVWGKDISGSMLPFGISANVAGMNWSASGGSNNTVGRLVRLSQWTDPAGPNYNFFDFGIDQQSDFFISDQNTWAGGGGVLPKKMITISPSDFVGINFNYGEHPTANFHTKGTVRFEGINTNNALTRVVVMDANGNLASRDASTLTGASNDWSLTGNSGTTAANFFGTTDNQRINFRTNNLTRMYLDQSIPAFGADLGHLSLSSETDVALRPSQLSVFGRDIAGASMPAMFVSYVGGATWGIAGGNTQGRFFRLSQMSTTFVQSHFYDVGMSQDSSLYIGNHGFQNVGGVTAKKMFTISPQDMVGINLDMSEKPTATFHTKGSLRFQNINTNNTFTRIVAMDVNGNVASRDASTLSGNDWALLGNSGTTAANFVGTTDDQRLYFRTNNKVRMFLEKSAISSGSDVSHLSISDEAGSATNPGQLSIWGREIVGVAANMHIANNVTGQTWGVAVGNTQGRMIRFSQMTSSLFTESHFYDVGISQDSSFYISDHWFQNGGPNIPKKMITISAQNLVGINLNNSEKPTANFHTKGTLRFEGVGTNNALTRIMAMDANGNVASRDASTLTGSGGLWVADANGIHNVSGNVGIGTSSNSGYKLDVADLSGSIAGGVTINFNSNDSWQTHLRLQNTNSNRAFSLVVGGTNNTQATYGVGANNFGIINNVGSTFPILIASDDKVGIGMGLGGLNNVPKAQLHLKTGDVYIEQIASGVIMKSPNGQCWRMTVSNAGAPVFTAIPCP